MTKENLSATTSDSAARIAVGMGPKWLLALVLGFVLVVLFISQAATPPATEREVRIFKVVDGMVQSGDYVLPRLAGKLRLDKPPLYYWAAVAADKVTGLAARIAYRVPSIVCGVALVLVVYGFCVRTGLTRLALPAALSLLAMATFYVNARSANFDMLLALFSFPAAALLAFHVQLETRRTLVLAGCAMALALMAKGTPAFAQVLIPSLVMMWITAKWRFLKRPSFWLGGFLLPCLALAAWGLAVLLSNEQPWHSFKEVLLLPLGVKGEHAAGRHFHDPFYFIYTLPLIAFPASLLLPVVIYRAISTRGYKESTVLRWALFSFLGVLLLHSIIPQKQPAYLMPILPYLAILTADAVAHGCRQSWLPRWGLAAGALTVGGLLLMAGAWLAHFTLFSPALPLAAVSTILFLALTVGTAIWVIRRDFDRALPLGFAGWLLALLLYAGSFQPLDAQFKTGEIFNAPDYDEVRWTALFEQHPKLKDVFNTRRKFLKGYEQDSGDDTDKD